MALTEKLFLLVFLFLFSFQFSFEAVPQICNKLFVSRNFQEVQYGNMTVSGDMELFKNANSTTIYITNVSVVGSLIYGPGQYFCVTFGNTETTPPAGACSTSMNASFNYTIINPSFNFQIYFPKNGYYFDVYYGFADDGTFSYKDGTFFTSENATFIEFVNDFGINSTYTQTCTSFLPAPIAPKNSTRCKTFKSQVLILNTTDNYSIYASSYMNWTLNGNELNVNGNSSAPGKFFFDYFFNDGTDECAGSGCSYKLKHGDKKLIISAAIEEYVGFDTLSIPIPMVGRIIFRGNQILMKEGIPFSPKNDCLYFNFPFSSDQVSTNKFCCIEFE